MHRSTTTPICGWPRVRLPQHEVAGNGQVAPRASPRRHHLPAHRSFTAHHVPFPSLRAPGPDDQCNELRATTVPMTADTRRTSARSPVRDFFTLLPRRPAYVPDLTLVPAAVTVPDRMPGGYKIDVHLRRPQLVERGPQCFVRGAGGVWSSALSDSCSKSACAFPMMSNAVRVFSRSASSFALRARSRSNSAASVDFFGCFHRPPRIGHTCQSPRISGTGPLDHVRRVQTLPAQDRALLTVRSILILRDDRQLVLRAERPPRRTRRGTACRPRTRRRRHLATAGRRNATLLR
jgi:hypothetical protein